MPLVTKCISISSGLKTHGVSRSLLLQVNLFQFIDTIFTNIGTYPLIYLQSTSFLTQPFNKQNVNINLIFAQFIHYTNLPSTFIQYLECALLKFNSLAEKMIPSLQEVTVYRDNYISAEKHFEYMLQDQEPQTLDHSPSSPTTQLYDLGEVPSPIPLMLSCLIQNQVVNLSQL